MDIEKLDNNFPALRRALDVSHLRNKVIAENLANSETPGFKAGKIDFQKAMSDAEIGADLAVSRTNSKHLAPSATKAGIRVEKSERQARADGNNVDQEIEIVNMSENTIIYNTATEILSRKLKMIDFAIEEGGK